MNATIAALVFVSLIWINSLIHYIKEPTKLNSWLMCLNVLPITIVVYKLVEKVSL